MTQVLQHDYGKSKVSLLQIRSAIKAVKKGRTIVASGTTPKRGQSASQKACGSRPIAG